MIKANQYFLTFLQIIVDSIILAFSLLLAYWIRFVSPFFHDGPRVLNLINYLHVLIFIIPVYLFCYFCLGLYKFNRRQNFYREIQRIFLANTLGVILTVTYLYYTKDVNYSRLMLGFFYLSTLIFMTIERYATRKFLRGLRARGYNINHIIVVGAGRIGRDFTKRIRDERELGYNIIGFVDDYFPKEEKWGIPVLGTTKEMKDILERNYVDEVVIALPNSSYQKINQVIDTCELAGVKTQVIPDYINLLQGSQPYIDELDGIPLINTRYIPLDNPFNNGLKRAFDIFGSSVLLLVLSPLLAVIAAAVKLTSPGPVIYKQKRLGRNRKEFTIYKFRSMRNDQPDKGTKGWTVKNDPRKTPLGTFLRKYSLDELPQLYNVLKGDMSLIGPRPELPYWVDQYKEKIPHYMIKHHVRPGITGLAQVRGWRGDTSIEERIKSDIDYIESWTPLLDLKILLLTPKAMLGGS